MNEPQARGGGMPLIIAASSLGTVFEWYDFFIYGTLASYIGKSFFPAGNATLQSLLVWATFAIGFGFRPLGALLFGHLGDRLGRKYTFLVTVTLMGLATAALGFVPPATSIGMAAPAIIIGLRILQGLALGGEYGGAAIYVYEHAPAGKSGFYSSFIQASVLGGFVFSLLVVLACKAWFSADDWAAWAWRVPFGISFILLAISLWMRLKLSESPVFEGLRADQNLARNPLIESLTTPGNKRRLLVAFLGLAAGMTVISYTSMFASLSFLQGPMRMEETPAYLLLVGADVVGMVMFPLVGILSDRFGRLKPILIGYVLTLVLVFPLYHFIGGVANPEFGATAARAPVVVAGPDCSYHPFASDQPTQCGKLLGDLAGVGISYTRVDAPAFAMTVAGTPLPLAQYKWADKKARAAQLQAWLAASGYSFKKVTPSAAQAWTIFLALSAVLSLLALTYGPMAALLAEMFPPRVRYSSLSVPYHIGTGYFGGFLPLISGYIVARSGDPYAGFWYMWGVVAMALVVASIGGWRGWTKAESGAEARAGG